MAERFTAGKFGLRALFALLLVVLTFNPTGYSYVHMIVDGFPKITPVEAVCGILLLIGWFVYLSATLRSIGLVGMLLMLALFAALIWMIQPHDRIIQMTAERSPGSASSCCR